LHQINQTISQITASHQSHQSHQITSHLSINQSNHQITESDNQAIASINQSPKDQINQIKSLQSLYQIIIPINQSITASHQINQVINHQIK
jgi:hypothetical protein